MCEHTREHRQFRAFNILQYTTHNTKHNVTTHYSTKSGTRNGQPILSSKLCAVEIVAANINNSYYWDVIAIEIQDNEKLFIYIYIYGMLSKHLIRWIERHLAKNKCDDDVHINSKTFITLQNRTS